VLTDLSVDDLVDLGLNGHQVDDAVVLDVEALFGQSWVSLLQDLPNALATTKTTNFVELEHFNSFRWVSLYTP
jgi:hypothetical protein